MFEITSFFIGFLVGVLILFVIFWLCYLTRIWFFTYCPTSYNECLSGDYYNNPSDALAAGADINQILFLNDQNEMFYKRVPKTTSCVPGPDQIVEITNPQYCDFKIGNIIHQGKNTTFESFDYEIPGSGPNPISVPVTTVGNCTPKEGSVASEGKAVLKWNSYT